VGREGEARSLGRRDEVDHFIPWARYPDDAVENLVAADGRCNSAKRDFLASGGHLGWWMERLTA
jgi:5-methylcytosine-specific restriction endonuclease McrA